jgi:hypothetical protein
VGSAVAGLPRPCGTTSIFAAGTRSRSTRSARVAAEIAITRSDVRAASGTSTRMPRPRRPKCASGTTR